MRFNCLQRKKITYDTYTIFRVFRNFLDDFSLADKINLQKMYNCVFYCCVTLITIYSEDISETEYIQAISLAFGKKFWEFLWNYLSSEINIDTSYLCWIFRNKYVSVCSHRNWSVYKIWIFVHAFHVQLLGD